MKQNRILFIGKTVIFILNSIWCLGILTSIILPVLYPLSKIFYSHVCHQNEAKTIYFLSKPLLVCARCSGIYMGCLISSFLLFIVVIKRLPIKYLFLSSIPVLVDVVFVQLGLISYSKYSAFITGLIFGSVTFLYIWVGIQKLLTEKN